jgi:hypothetical protein
MSKNILITTDLVSNDVVDTIDDFVSKGYRVTFVYVGNNYTEEQVFYYYNCLFAHHIRNNSLKIICCEETINI